MPAETPQREECAHEARAGRWPLPLTLVLPLLALLPACVVMTPEPAAPSGEPYEGRVGTPAGNVSAPAPLEGRGLPGVLDAGEAARSMTAALLQSELLAFADRYLEGIAEAADWGADHTDDARVRAAFRDTKVIYVTGMVTAVSAPDPLRALRDLLVMLRLQVSVWESGGHRWATPAAAARMVRALTTLEEQLVLLARRVLPAEAIELIDQLTQRWRAANPDRRYVAFLRFHDLGDSELRRRFETHVNARGLLAPVAEASREIQEMRQVAERGVFLANHMPLLLEWQSEALVYNTLKIPEVQGVFGNLDRYADTAEVISNEIAALPSRITAERAAALENFAHVLQREREATLEQFARQIGTQRELLFRDFNTSAGELLPLAQQLAIASAGLRETMTLVAAMQGGDSSGFDIVAAQTLVQNATSLTRETAELARTLQDLLGAETSASSVARIDQLMQQHERRLFRYAVALILISGAVVCVIMLIVRRKKP